ncbi:MAG: replication initiator protein A, partial [Oscillospiraceae bacterium]|nr:replication initiator protein A [Oscillospiraceae bacterium]
MNNNFYKIDEISQHKYYQVPKELYTNERYKTTINNDAKVLYSLLLDRMELSRKNDWVDEDGTIFLMFKREDLADMLGICVTTVWRAFKQLKDVGLIAEKRQGLNRPNLIYIGKINYSTPENKKDKSDDTSSLPSDSEILNDRSFNNSNTRVLNAKNQDFENIKTNKTDINNTEFSNTDQNNTESLKNTAEEKNNTAVDSS